MHALLHHGFAGTQIVQPARPRGSSTAPFPMDRYLDHRVGSSRAYQRRMHQGGVDEWSVVKVNKFGWSQKRVIMIDFDARVLR